MSQQLALRLLMKSSWVGKFQDAQEGHFASQDNHQRKKARKEPTAEPSPLLEDGSDINSNFLYSPSRIIKFTEPCVNPTDAFENEKYSDSEGIRSVVEDLGRMVEEDETEIYLKALEKKRLGPTARKYIDEMYEAKWTEGFNNQQFCTKVLMLQKLKDESDGLINFECDSCFQLHPLEESKEKFICLVIGDSMLRTLFFGEGMAHDVVHFDYILRSGLSLKYMIRMYIQMYQFERKPQLIALHCGINDVAQGKSADKMAQDITDFEKVLDDLDKLHDRKGQMKSRLYLITIPQSPRYYKIPTAGVMARTEKNTNKFTEAIIEFNYFVGWFNSDRNPGVSVPTSHQKGWRSKAKNKAGDRHWTPQKGDWRQSEWPNAVHWENGVAADVLKAIQVFLVKERTKFNNATDRSEERLAELGFDSNSNSESLVLRITTNDSESEEEDYDLITSVADSDLIL